MAFVPPPPLIPSSVTVKVSNSISSEPVPSVNLKTPTVWPVTPPSNSSADGEEASRETATVPLAATVKVCPFPAGVSVIAAPVEAPVPETPRTITVVGEGLVSLVPDVARINVGAEVRADTVAEAKTEVDRQVAAIMAVLQESGVESKDIQSNHYSIHYEREQMTVMHGGPPAPNQEGYRVSNMLRVTVRDVERAGGLLDAIVEAGANQVWGVTFTVSDESAWQGQARAKAMADARARAAEVAGLEQGKVLSVSEVIGGMGYRPIAAMREYGVGGGGGFAPGELEIGTQVEVVFAVK